MKYMIKISYDGSRFYGFQRQKDKITVQGELEKALTIINKKEVLVKGAGRTDIGVHANGQVVHFEIDYGIPSERLMDAINSIVHPYINVLSCEKVDNDFHARFSVKSKEYIYKIWTGNYDPLKYNYFLMYENKLNIRKLKECAKLFVGKHNFHNFVSGERVNNNSEIYSITIKNKKNEVWIVFNGKSFYRYMVRNLVGTILDYNEDKCDLETIKKMISDDKFNKQLRTASANGLYLNDIKY